MVAAEAQEHIESTVLRWYLYCDDFNDALGDLRCYVCCLFPPFPTVALSCIRHQAGGRIELLNYWPGRPFMLANKREPFQHNCWHRPMLPFKDGLPAGFCGRCKCVPLLSSGFILFPPPSLFGGVVVVVNTVGCQTTPGGLGQPFCGPWSRCGLETIDVQGSADATLQLLKQRTELSKNTIILFLTSIRKKTNIRTCWGPRNALAKKKKEAYLKQFFAVDTAVVLQTLSPGKSPPDLREEEFYCSR